LQIATPAPRKPPLSLEVSPKAAGPERGRKASDSEERYPALFGRLRDLRAVTQNLRGFAADLDKRTKAIEDPVSRRREVQAGIEEGTPVLIHDHQQIARRLEEIRENIEKDDGAYSAYGDVIARLEGSWEEALTNWPLGRDLEEYIAQSAQRLPKLVASLDAMIYDCGLVTLPSRIRDHLALIPIGGSLGLRDGYEDELPEPADQRRFLHYLSLYPGFVEGLVDVENGCIFRADRRLWRRALSLVLTVAFALLGFPVIWIAIAIGKASSVSGTDWPFTTARKEELIFAYLFLLLGAVAHIVVNMLKQDRAEKASTRGLSDWLLRIHVKETSFWASAASLALGPLAMAFLFKTVGWKSAFFFGYSYDSFLDLFLQRFQGSVTSVAELMKKG